MTHTPGPWYTVELTDQQKLLIRSDKAYVGCLDADVETARIAGNSTKNADNARLIAAAPDLLAACKALIREWEGYFEGQGTGFDDTGLHHCVIKAEKAIAKAEGK